MASEPKHTLEEILRLLGMEAQVEEQPLDEGILLDIQGADTALLTGRNGQVLSDLQYILNRILFQADSSMPKVTVDVGGYRSKARQSLVDKAMEAAEKVRRWGDIVEMEPLTAFDRRIVHNALKDDPTVETHSIEVEGTKKKVVLLRPRA